MPGIDDVMSFITQGSLFGLPASIFMTMPFIIGLILGFMIKKALKWAVIGIVIVGAALYLGVLNMGDIQKYLVTLKQNAPEIMQYAAIILGMLPLGMGLAVGLIIGLKYG